ncbi:HNH endonuclease signature motif containing protein [Helicobacter pylori]|uniref:HNH endonuclease signature motif containing protein n=1 Tax=Helicobacter pylori TaxID=210 RepID=UPI002929BEA8|nr:HNH endonuclease signature motif containing protein [Helicobacter pylori]MDU9764716.1 HNH endonuclease signature motif containing protein [Helicobacter pylori]
MGNYKQKKNIYRVENFEEIQEIIIDKSQSLYDYMDKHKSSEYILYYKMLSHSDLPNFAKMKNDESLDKNLLYYLSAKEMREIERRENREFEVAKQSNISMSIRFWKDLDMPDPRDSVKKRKATGGDHLKINDYAKVFLVNDVLENFHFDDTLKIFEKLHKDFNPKQFNANTMSYQILNNQDFTPIELHQAVHGIGMKQDVEFNKLRHNLFKNDLLYLLIEKTQTQKNLFIMPFRNPLFFSLLGVTNSKWQIYQEQKLKRENNLITKSPTPFQEEKIQRQHQNKWREALAFEMMNYTMIDRSVFCPLTYIEADFDDMKTLFRASHIKGYSDCDEEEKYDLNNGLLLIANADALFDKHFITIDENKQLKFSYLLENNHKLKSQLNLNNGIFKDILNDRRMQYLAYHRKIFEEKEQERKTKES